MKGLRFVFILLLLLVAFGLIGMWATRTALPGSKGDVVLGQPGKLERLVVNVGKIYYGQSTSRLLSIENASDRALPLGWQVACGCTRIKLLGPSVPPRGRSAMRITYSGTSPSLAGPVSQPFLIFEADRTATPEIRGLVKAFLVPSLQFNRTEITWRYQPGSLGITGQYVSAKNITGHAVVLIWKSGGRGMLFSVNPVSATVSPGKSVEFHFSPSPELGRRRRPYTAVSVLLGETRSGGRRISLRFAFNIYANPEPALEAVPGSLVLSPRHSVYTLARTIRLVAGRQSRPRVRDILVSTSSPKLVAVLRGQMVHVSLHLAKGEKLFEGEVTVDYKIGSLESALHIPVFATR